MKQKKEKIKKVDKVQKCTNYLVKIIFEGIVIGVITSLVVAYLLSTPVISLKDSRVFIKDNKIEIKTIYENKGQSPAINVETTYIYGKTEKTQKILYG